MSEQQRDHGRKLLEEYFNAHISRGKRRFHTSHPPDYWNTISDRHFDDFMSVNKISVEESFDISLREEDFERLLDLIGYFQAHNPNNGYYQELESKLAFERRLRKNNPALQKAYEKYKMLVDIVANGKEIED